MRFYSKLSVFRSVILEIAPCVWWNVSKCDIRLKRACVTMVKLLSGSTCLRYNKDVNLPRNERLCGCCTEGVIENLFHFVMICEHFSEKRLYLHATLEQNLTVESKQELQALPEETFFLILMGMEYPLNQTDLWLLRYVSCQSIHSMYCERARMEIQKC